jgi:predicted site-specific integrase-resolvase
MRPHEFAERLGVSVKTLHRWDESGKLKAKRTLSNHRYYTEDDLAVARGLQSSPSKRQVIVYCRVSSAKQKTELQNQRAAMEQFCPARGLSIYEYVCEIGGGMNFKANWIKLSLAFWHNCYLLFHESLNALKLTRCQVTITLWWSKFRPLSS